MTKVIRSIARLSGSLLIAQRSHILKALLIVRLLLASDYIQMISHKHNVSAVSCGMYRQNSANTFAMPLYRIQISMPDRN
jgi:hypothetical protein